MKSSGERDDRGWVAKANSALDQMEEHPEDISKLTWALLCAAAGVERTTLWRHKGIRERFNALQKVHRAIVRPSQKNRRARRYDVVEDLRRQVQQLKVENEGHMSNYVAIALRLEERNIDPVQIFKGLSAIKTVNSLGPRLAASRGSRARALR